MTAPANASTAAKAAAVSRWWRRQTPVQQDRIATLGPLLSVLLFLAAMIAAFWYLRWEERQRESEAVWRDAEIAQQQLRLRLSDNEQALSRLARDVGTRALGTDALLDQVSDLLLERSEVAHMAWIGADREPRVVLSDRPFHPEANPEGKAPSPTLPSKARSNESETTFQKLETLRVPVYSSVFADSTGGAALQLQVPIVRRDDFQGALIAQYSLDRLLRRALPADITRRHSIQIIDAEQRVVASTEVASASRVQRQAVHEALVPLSPLVSGLSLRVLGWQTSLSFVGNTLFWMVLALSGLSLWMLLGTWRHMRRRSQIQATLVQETNFRRAMENSMLTGMRAMDREGRITYVNPAFCAMTGLAEHELVGREPPYPFWPHDAVDENMRLLQQEIDGRSPIGGIEVRLQRKDGAIFDTRMYISPLVDPKGQQTGWITSVTNITEAKRIRDQLSASHERFTTVLEGLDAGVSVLSVQQGELLFCNRTYRHWFGSDASGHALLAGSTAALPPLPNTDAVAYATAAAMIDTIDQVDAMSGLPMQELADLGAAPREVFVASMQKWFDVRARYLQWTDGRLVQMLIATDVTERRRGEELARQQAEKAQVTSRLVTMGEMASSVAHELNQPLTAITNYCHGLVSRVRAKSIGDEDLVATLEKTAKQADRAAQVIRRIRAFVKRSEPQRRLATAAEIVEDAVELADIELRRRNVRLEVYVAKNLPPLSCDPILIEQVVLNLVKNAAEAIDTTHMPTARRQVELRVIPRHSAEEGGTVEFSVTDKGPGMREDVLARLYEAFFSTKVEGLGIGLSLCRSIVESHRGRIKGLNLYNGNVVVGCQFTFTLPVDHTSRPEALPTQSAQPAPPTATTDAIL